MMSIIALHIFSHVSIKHVYILSLVLIYFVGSFLFYKKIFGDPELKKFFLDSLRDSSTRKASGKSLTAFYLSNIVGVATIIAVIYAPQHLLPEYYLITILSFIASLYGISMVSKYFTGGNGNGNGKTNTTDTPVVVATESEEEKKKKEEEEKKKNPPSDDVG